MKPKSEPVSKPSDGTPFTLKQQQCTHSQSESHHHYIAMDDTKDTNDATAETVTTVPTSSGPHGMSLCNMMSLNVSHCTIKLHPDIL